jgi:DNA repair photolyase
MEALLWTTDAERLRPLSPMLQWPYGFAAPQYYRPTIGCQLATRDWATPMKASACAGVFDFLGQPLRLAKNGFKNKSLSDWAVNIAVGCRHACRFCYVPSSATIKQGPNLEPLGIEDPDREWGDYVLLRTWDPDVFRRDVRAANNKPRDKLKRDGNRAVMYCSTTDPYQVFPAGPLQHFLASAARKMVRESLEIILRESTLNVRILTRSPLAKRDFDLFEEFAKQNRILFGMSVPTTNESLQKVYEPKAPAARARFDTLKAARDAGVPVYVAMAPIYPECDEADIRKTLAEIEAVNPLTVFVEGINLRAENAKRIWASEEGSAYTGARRTEVFKSLPSARKYVLDTLKLVERLAPEFGLSEPLHLWPDPGPKGLENQTFVKSQENRVGYEEWLARCLKRVSEWPGKK